MVGIDSQGQLVQESTLGVRIRETGVVLKALGGQLVDFIHKFLVSQALWSYISILSTVLMILEVFLLKIVEDFIRISFWESRTGHATMVYVRRDFLSL